MEIRHRFTGAFTRNRYLCYVVFFFGVVYSLISLVNHFNFRTYALDLGLYNNALYQYSHGHWSNSTVMQESKENLLADHFDLDLILFSPLSYIFGTYTLLIIQIISVLLGGIGVYKFFEMFDNGKFFSLSAAVHFYFFFGIYSALAFDYHSNVVAAMAVPWFFYFFKSKKFRIAAGLLLFICFAKENMALWMFFVCTGLLFEYRKDKKAMIILSCYAVFALVCFITVVHVIMPSLAGKNSYPHFFYSFLGTNVFDAASTIFSLPFAVVKALFVNHTGNPAGDYLKPELYSFVLFSGGALLFAKPHFIIMLIPIFFQKMFHDNVVMWSVSGQYSIEFAPIVTIGSFAFIAGLKNRKVANSLRWLLLILTLAVTIRRMDRTVIFTDTSRVRFYQRNHFVKDYDVRMVHEALDKIPSKATVSVQSPFLSHLAMRDKIYQFPILLDADYLVFSVKESPYPLSEKGFENELNAIYSSNHWETFVDTCGFKIWKRKR